MVELMTGEGSEFSDSGQRLRLTLGRAQIIEKLEAWVSEASPPMGQSEAKFPTKTKGIDWEIERQKYLLNDIYKTLLDTAGNEHFKILRHFLSPKGPMKVARVKEKSVEQELVAISDYIEWLAEIAFSLSCAAEDRAKRKKRASRRALRQSEAQTS